MTDAHRDTPGEPTVRLMGDLLSDIARLGVAVQQQDPRDIRTYANTIADRAERLATALQHQHTMEGGNHD